MDPLATVEDLEARLGRDLTAEEAARADALLADASALIRGWTGQDFTLVEGDVITLRPVGTVVRLPQRPVQAVTAVVATGGSEAIPDVPLPAGAWTWDGIDKVDIWPPDTSWLLSLPETWADGALVDTYRITYAHGWDEVPADVVAVVCAMVLRTLLAPSPIAGMVSERIGQYNYQLQQSTGSVGATVMMTQADRDALARYRRTATTIQTRAG